MNSDIGCPAVVFSAAVAAELGEPAVAAAVDVGIRDD